MNYPGSQSDALCETVPGNLSCWSILECLFFNLLLPFFRAGFTIYQLVCAETDTSFLVKQRPCLTYPSQKRFTGACDDTCLAPDLTKINRIFHPFAMACPKWRLFKEAVVWVELQYYSIITVQQVS